MVRISFLSGPLEKTKPESVACFVQEGEKDGGIKEIESLYLPQIKAYLKKEDFTGQAGKVVAIPIAHDKKMIPLFIVGLGKKQKSKPAAHEQWRRSVGQLIKMMQAKKVASCTVILPALKTLSATSYEAAKEMTIAATMSAYRFDEYITNKKQKVNQDLSLECITALDKKDLNKGVKEGQIVAQAVNKVRHWIDLPPSALTPTELAGKAKEIAKEHNLAITVFDEKKVKAMGMGGLAGVSAGSEQDCKFVIMEYAARKTAPTIVLVGKGITFDSGGLSLKPPQYMETMKEDMSGAAAVIGTMQALAQLKPKANVVGITALSENLPSGKATKPGDIITFYNGKTAEVKNTDAEGRLVLADALAYAVKHYEPAFIIDIATLTGACAHALGPFFTGMMGQHESLLKKVEESGQRSGDRVWRLPFTDEYKVAIKSPVADLCNIGSPKYMAGSITAGFFLQAFVGDVPWVHLDIAGTAFDVPGVSYYSSGATGVGVRLFVDLVQNWK